MEEPNKNLGTVVKKFSKNSTIHGISHMWSESRFKTSVWLILLFLSLLALLLFILFTVVNYLKYDTIGNSYVIMNVPMKLPTITICNMNSYKSNMNYSIDQMLLYCKFENTRCHASHFVEVKISTYKCYSFNSGRDSSGHQVDLFKSSKKGYLYGVTLKLFAGFPEEANLYMNGFLVFIQ